MTADWRAHAERLGLTAAEIERLTGDAFAELLRRLREGQDPQTAIQGIIGDFDAGYRSVLAAAFSETLGRFVGPDELRAYPIGPMALSQRLYQHAAETTVTVREIVRRHAAGYHDARALTLQIYEGYGFKGGKDPLQWPAGSPKWPKYMREAITEDPASFQQYRAIARQAANRIKTPALRAAYSEALDELEKGTGFEHLGKKLNVAFEERMRYHANRIAQTELHRAWAGQQAEEIMADETIEVVKFEMSATHPRTDICDLYANQDAYGLGPGLYPKDAAPVPPLHPFCRCMLVSRRLISAKGAKFKPEAHRSYLRQVMREGGVSEAAKVVGSRAKLAVALTQSPVEAVFNIHRPVPYRLGRVGDNAGMKKHALALANVESAEIPLTKLAGYALNPDHPTGSHKARRIKAALGFEAKDAEAVSGMVRSIVQAHPAIDGPQTKWGRTYYVDLPLTGPAGSAIVRTAWIVESGKTTPRMTSFYVKES